MAPSPSAGCEVVCVASWNADLVSHIDRPLGRGETLMASAFAISPGGKGSNAAVAWQAEGIDSSYVLQASGESSGVAQILVYDDGNNSIAVCPGAGAGLSAQHVEAAREILRDCRVVMASCEVPLAATERAFQIAREAGAITLLNPAPALPLPDALLALTDLLTPNESEVRLLAGMAADAPVASAAQALLARGVAAVLVTLGAKGCELHRAGQVPYAIAGRSMAVLDTIGAGDTFTGALAAALARGDDLPQAMACANAAAALSVTGRGAIGGMPDLPQVRALMAQVSA